MSCLHFTTDAAAVLAAELDKLSLQGPVMVLADTNTDALAGQLVSGDTARCVVAAGEESKDFATLGRLWHEMTGAGLTRGSVLVCVGGGVVTDLGGFAAATFKRGIACVNVPTSLLAMVDASVGGKTGIDFDGLKNQVGAFARPTAVVVSPQWLSTLPRREWLSGYGEMLKHALLDGAQALAALPDIDGLAAATPERQLQIIRESVAVKERIVEADPLEREGLRASLNLGHTAGHALESLLAGGAQALPHGAAVAFGLVVALVLSRMLLDMPSEVLYTVAGRVKSLYGPLPVGCADHDRLLALMHNDKKNTTRESGIRFVLLRGPGEPVTGVSISDTDTVAALDIAADLL